MTSIRVGVIGAGNIAQFHLAVLKALPEVEIIVLCDKDPATLNQTGDRFQIANRTTSHKELLESHALDAVFVSTWTKLNLYFSPQLFGPQSVTSVV